MQINKMHLAVFRENMRPVLTAVSAVLEFGRCSVPTHVMKHAALLGTLSQHLLGRKTLQRKRFRGNERLQLLCCSSPASALLLCLATVVDPSDHSAVQHKIVARVMKRYFSGIADRL